MGSRQLRPALLTLAFVFIAGGFAVGAHRTAASSAALAQSAQPATLTWHACAADAPPTSTRRQAPRVAPPPESVQCAELQVPLDYAHPHGPRITVGINRLKASDPARRIGSLIFNPGGPGAPATLFVAAAAAGVPVFTPAVRERFDVIGMDPRGVGSSTPVRCDPAVWNDAVSQFPRDAAAFERLVAHNRALGESCLRLTGPLLGHVDTVSVARDLEALRLALHEGKLNYLGLSYGTQLGHQYAALYPQNIRVMALDGALDHAVPPVSMLTEEAGAYERAFGRFARWCAETANCALHGQDVEALFDRLIQQADETPLPAPRCAASGACRATVTGEDIRFNAQNYLLFKDGALGGRFPGWSQLATALKEALAGDASGLGLFSALADSDHFGGFAELAIECVDWATPISRYDEMAATEVLGRVVAPHMQGATQTWTIQAGCVGWPVPVSNPQRPAPVRGAPPILIVNAMYDPSTAYPWAVGMLQQIKGSVLLTRDGDGHTSYWLTGPSQTRDAIDTYLISGATPPPNSVYPN